MASLALRAHDRLDVLEPVVKRNAAVELAGVGHFFRVGAGEEPDVAMSGVAYTTCIARAAVATALWAQALARRGEATCAEEQGKCDPRALARHHRLILARAETGQQR
jgi:hypothetical protein